MTTTLEPVAYDDDSRPHALITADKVSGTDVYNEAGDRLGAIDSIVIDKFTGEVAYVVMSFGGFLGIGEKYHPLPWDVLEYDTNLAGYRADLDRDDLIDAPSYDREAIDAYDYDRDFGGVGSFYVDKSRFAQEVDVAPRSDINAGRARPLGEYSRQARADRTEVSDDAASDVNAAAERTGAFDHDR